MCPSCESLLWLEHTTWMFSWLAWGAAVYYGLKQLDTVIVTNEMSLVWFIYPTGELYGGVKKKYMAVVFGGYYSADVTSVLKWSI